MTNTDILVSKRGSKQAIATDVKQGVALTGRMGLTLLARRRVLPPGHLRLLRCICAAVECYRRRQMTTDAREHH